MHLRDAVAQDLGQERPGVARLGPRAVARCARPRSRPPAVKIRESANRMPWAIAVS
jgi:hypothetical protein